MDEQDKIMANAAALTAGAQLKVLSVKPGDILHVRLGLTSEEMGDGQPPWIPGDAELEYVVNELHEILPEGVHTWVTHLGIEIDAVIKDDTNNS